MKKTLSSNNVADALRADENGGWSYYGAEAMAEYLERLEEDTGEDMELDVVAIRCDFSEYETALEYANEFGDFELSEDSFTKEGSAPPVVNDEVAEAEAIAWLEERTVVIPFNHDNTFMEGRTSGFIIQSF